MSSEAHRRANRRWQEAHPEKNREMKQAWASANPEKRRETSRRFRLSEKGRKAERDYYVANRDKRQRRVAATRDWVNAVKSERGCSDCGFRGNPVALDFDHLPGSGKVEDVSHMLSWSWAKIRAEIAKCEVVCANCHRIRTAERGSGKRSAPTAPEVPPSLFDVEGVA